MFGSMLWTCDEVLLLPDLIRVVLKEYKNIYPEVMKRAARTFEQVGPEPPDHFSVDHLVDRTSADGGSLLTRSSASN